MERSFLSPLHRTGTQARLPLNRDDSQRAGRVRGEGGFSLGYFSVVKNAVTHDCCSNTVTVDVIGCVA